MQNLNKSWPCGLKYDMRHWMNFHLSTQKSDKLYFDGLFLFKAYVSAKKINKNYVSWHWRVMQNLKENWLVTWFVKSILCLSRKSTEELCAITLENDAKLEEKLTCALKNDMRNLAYFNRTLKSCTLMSSFWSRSVIMFDGLS